MHPPRFFGRTIRFLPPILRAIVLVTLLHQSTMAQRWHSMQRPVTFVATSPSNGIHIISTLGWVIQSWDGGKTWEHQQLEQHVHPTIPSHEDLEEIAFCDSLTGLILGTDHCFHTTDGGHTWRAFAYRDYGVYSNLRALKDGTFHFIDASGRIYSGRTTFTGAFPNDSKLQSLQSTTDDYLIAQGTTGTIRSSDGGISWVPLKDHATAVATWTDHLHGLSMSISDYALRTHDGGATWDTIGKRYFTNPIRLDSELIEAGDFLFNARTGDTANIGRRNTHFSAVARLGRTFLMVSDNYIDAARFYFSGDTGRTWTETLNLDPMEYYGSAGIYISPNSTLTSASDTCYYESNDTGATWRRRNGPGLSRILCLKDSLRLAWSGEVLSISHDAGTTWAVTPMKPAPNGNGGNLYSSGSNVLITNMKQAWTTSDFVNFSIVAKFSPGVVSVKGDTILMSGYDSTKKSGLIISYDAGTTWNSITSVKYDSVLDCIQYIGSGVMLKVSNLGGLAISQNFGKTWKTIWPGFRGNAYFLDPLHGVAASGEMYSTIDGGITWRQDHTEHPQKGSFDNGGSLVGLAGNYLNALTADGYIRSTFAELFRTGPDSTAFPKPIRWRLGKATVDNLVETANGTLIKVTEDSRQAYWSTNRGISWTIAADSIYPRMRSFVVHGNEVIALTHEDIPFLRTSDNGASWHPWNTKFPNINWNIDYSLTFAKNGTAFIGTTSGLFHSTINDTTFDMHDTLFARRDVRGFAVDSNGTLYAHVSPGRYTLPPDSLFRSTDNGVTWYGIANSGWEPPVTTYSFAPSDRVFSIQHDEVEIAYATDGLSDWTRIKPPPYAGATSAISMVALNDSTLFYSNGYLWYTTDLGKHWWKCDTLGQFNENIIRTRAGYLAVATRERDVAVTVLPISSGTLDVSPIREAQHAEMYILYPNPTTGFVHLSPIPAAKLVHIYTSTAETVGERSIGLDGGIDLNGIPSGDYWIGFEMSEGLNESDRSMGVRGVRVCIIH